MALLYSIAEYCSPVWEGSTHCRLIDIELRKGLRIITGTVKSTKVQWLSVLANIEPLHIRRQNTVLRIAYKLQNNLVLLPIHEYGVAVPRLKSRHPFIARLEAIKNHRSLQPDPWKEDWEIDIPINGSLVNNVHSKPPGSDLPRKLWTKQNRIRTGQGRCNYLLHKWKIKTVPKCDCGADKQTMEHIVSECAKRKFTGTLSEIHAATDKAIKWLDSLDIEI